MTSTIKNNLASILESKGYKRRNGKFQVGEAFLCDVGITPHHLNKVVDNEADLTVTQLHSIAHKLGVSIDAVYEITDNSKKDNPVSRLPWASKS